MDIEDIEDYINDLDWKINNRLVQIKMLKKEKLIYQRLLKTEKELKKLHEEEKI
jgi:hypothetical protein